MKVKYEDRQKQKVIAITTDTHALKLAWETGWDKSCSGKPICS